MSDHEEKEGGHHDNHDTTSSSTTSSLSPDFIRGRRDSGSSTDGHISEAESGYPLYFRDVEFLMKRRTDNANHKQIV